MEQIVNDLIKFFLDEKDHPVIDIPKNYVSKREFLRGLINVREAKSVPNDIISKENELLQGELKEKKIVDISSFDNRLSLYQGDVTSVKCDGIVNLTDDKLLGCFKPNHNCVSNKIHSYAGISLRLKCKEITKGQSINVSKVILTDGYNLPCKYIIHAVKPNVDFGINDEIKSDIVNMYINSMELAKKNDIKSLCIPNLSVESQYKEEVAKIMIDTIRSYLNENNEIEKVLINVYTLEDYNIFSSLLDWKE